MKLKGKYSESAPLYAILLSVGAVAAVAVFFIVNIILGGELPGLSKPAEDTSASQSEEQPPEDNGDEAANEALVEEVKDAVEKHLIIDNHAVLKLFYTKGLKHKDEPYGNDPEDGYFSVTDSEYTSVDQIFDLVDRTFVPEAAERIKTDPLGLGIGPVYKTRDNGDLGINAKFAAMEYKISWTKATYKIKDITDTSCSITLTLHKKSDKSDVEVDAELKKTEDGWRFTDIVY